MEGIKFKVPRNSIPRSLPYMPTEVRPFGESMKIRCSPLGWCRPALCYAIFKSFVATTEWRVI